MRKRQNDFGLVSTLQISSVLVFVLFGTILFAKVFTLAATDSVRDDGMPVMPQDFTPEDGPTCTPGAPKPPTPTPGPPTPSPSPVPPPNIGCWGVTYSENFDGVIAPALPSGWSSSFSPGASDCVNMDTCPSGTNWRTSTEAPYTAPNIAFHDTPDCVMEANLDTLPIHNGSPPFMDGHFLFFTHSFDFENGYDGGVLEISINGGPFTDIFAAGGTLFSGVGYNGTIACGYSNPLAGRPAWTGNSHGYVTTGIRMLFLTGQTAVFRFRVGSDCSNGGGSWRIDNLDIRVTIECQGGISGRVGNCASPAPTATPPASPTPPILPPVPNVTMTLSGFSGGSTTTDASGNYSFTIPSPSGSYTVTPSKGAVAPGSPGISTVDVLAVQRHFLLIAIIPAGCRLTAADAVVNGVVNTQDVIAIHRFFLGFTTGIGSVGQYRFAPANRTYNSPPFPPATGQDYAALVIGDVTSPFVAP